MVSKVLCEMQKIRNFRINNEITKKYTYQRNHSLAKN